jgi:hypothetical protein
VPLSPAKPPHQGDEIDQIPNPKPRPAGRHDNKQILGHHTRPARGQRCQVSGWLAVEDPIFTPAVSANNHVEFLPELRVERVGDPNWTCQILGVRCS